MLQHDGDITEHINIGIIIATLRLLVMFFYKVFKVWEDTIGMIDSCCTPLPFSRRFKPPLPVHHVTPYGVGKTSTQKKPVHRITRYGVGKTSTQKKPVHRITRYGVGKTSTQKKPVHHVTPYGEEEDFVHLTPNPEVSRDTAASPAGLPAGALLPTLP